MHRISLINTSAPSLGNQPVRPGDLVASEEQPAGARWRESSSVLLDVRRGRFSPHTVWAAYLHACWRTTIQVPLDFEECPAGPPLACEDILPLHNRTCRDRGEGPSGSNEQL
jgi:hypothetical protein